jgi:hypothetical protein
LTKWNRKKKRHRVDYEDGDHEWINLENEHDRVMILEEGERREKHWVMMTVFEPPLLAKRRHRDYEQHAMLAKKDKDKKAAVKLAKETVERQKDDEVSCAARLIATQRSL